MTDLLILLGFVFGVLLIALGVAVFVAVLQGIRATGTPLPVGAKPKVGRVQRRRVEPGDLEKFVVTIPPDLLNDVDREAWEEARRAVEGRRT